MRDLRARLDPLVVAEPPCENAPRGRAAAGVRWVEPTLVAEIEFFDWNGRDALRHASFEGLRLDKPAGEVVFEETGASGAKSRRRRRRGERAEAPASAEPPQAAAVDRRRPAPQAAPRRAPAAAAGPGRGRQGGAAAELSAAWPSATPIASCIRTSGSPSSRSRATTRSRRAHVPYIARRPLTLVRCPGGAAAQCFFQKHLAAHVPDGVLEVPVRESGATAIYPAVESPAGVLALVQMGALELHVWGSHIETLEQPDQMVFDLDPDDGLPFAPRSRRPRPCGCCSSTSGLRSFVKTSGGKGLHVVVPLRPTRSWDEVKDFSHAIADLMVRAEPQRYLATMSRSKRAGKVFIDYLRNGRGATFVAPYSTRRRPGAPVSAPCAGSSSTPTAARRVHRGQRRPPPGGRDAGPLAGLRRDRPGDHRRHDTRRGPEPRRETSAA